MSPGLKENFLRTILYNRLKRTLQVELVRVSLVLAGLGLVFLSGPIVNFPKGYFASADILQSFPAFQVSDKPPLPYNTVVSDEIFEFLPWLDFERRSLFNGEIPLWNPFNAGGRPLLANMQSSFFNPVVWPQLLLGNHFGLLIKAFLELFLAGFFSFLFFRLQKVSVLAALAGAIAVEFMGFEVVWLKTPLLNTFLIFPLTLYLIEKRMQGGSKKGFVLGLGLAVAWEIFAGHPETAYMNTLVGTPYLVFRLATAKKEWGGVEERLKTFGLYALAGIVGVLLGAVQLLPFIEYFLNSAVFGVRGKVETLKLEAFKSISFLLPNPFGNPAYSSISDLNFAVPNYSEVSGGYVGTTVIFLALLALWVARRRAVTWFAAGCALVCFGVTYGIWPFYQLVTGSLPVSLAYNRLVGYCGYMLIFLMVLALHEILSRFNYVEVKDRLTGLSRTAWMWPLLAGIAFLVLMFVIFWQFSVSGVAPFERASVRNFEWGEFFYTCLLFGAGLVFLTLALRCPRRQWLYGGLLALVIFGQLATFGRLYRSGTEATLFYPQTNTMQALEKNAGRLTTGGAADLMPAEVNIWYDLPQVSGYDAMEVRWFDELNQAVEERWPGWDNPIPLNLFNIKQVLASAYDPNFQGIDATNTKQLHRQSKQRALNIYVNTNYQPQYRLVYSAVVQGEKQLEQSLLSGSINPITQVGFIQGSEPDVLPSPGFESAQLPTPPEVKVVSKTNNRAVLQVNNPLPGYLYIDQTYFQGWEAKINGQAARLYRANYAFTALPVPTGQLTIELEYSPWSFKIGGIISLVTLAGLGIFYGFSRAGWKIRLPGRRRKRKIKPAKPV